MKHTGLLVIIIYTVVVTITTQYGRVFSSSVIIRLLECGYSFTEGTQLVDHDIMKVQYIDNSNSLLYTDY